MNDSNVNMISNVKSERLLYSIKSVLQSQPLIEASIDNQRIFERVVELSPEYNSYQILTKYGVLDRNYLTSNLNPRPSQFDLEIPDPPSTAAIILHYYAAQESISEKIPVHCNCRDQKT